MNIYAWQIGFVQHIDHQIAKGNDVVSPTGRFEVKLVERGKDHIPAEGLDRSRVGLMMAGEGFND